MSSVPFKVKALFDYTSPHDEDLSFPNSQIITVTEEEDADWYYGDYKDASGTKKEGLFPRNFVEKYEPAPPPRPTRTTRPKKEPESEPEPVSESRAINEDDNVEETPTLPVPPIAVPTSKTDSVHPSTSPPHSTRQDQVVDDLPTESPPPAPKPKAAVPVASKPPPPAVAEKPVSGSFRDRIAAFNKPAAPPVAPFKPGSLSGGGSGFIKKPFVAPPPSKDSYVPPPRAQAPAKVYRREEDPELTQAVDEDLVNTRSVPSLPASPEEDPDQPKPTSLKERIALLQKQQLEQASRHADAAQKKDKPKRPKQARNDSSEPVEDNNEDLRLEKINSSDTIEADSTRPSKDEAEIAPRPSRRKSSRDVHSSSGILANDIPSDANDADQSAAGETTEEAEDTSTGRDEESKSKIKGAGSAPAPPSRAPAAPTEEADVGDEEDDAEEDEEEDVDPEVRRKMEIRERMAKMSGGMGMAGMFGPPGGMPPLAAKKKKPQVESRSISEQSEAPGASSVLGQAPPIPIIPMTTKAPARPTPRSIAPPNDEEEDEDEEDTAKTNHQGRGIAEEQATSEDTKRASRALPPAPRSQPPSQARPIVESIVPLATNEHAAPPVPSHHSQPIQESPTLGNQAFDEDDDIQDDLDYNDSPLGMAGEQSRGLPPPLPKNSPIVPIRPVPEGGQARADRKVSDGTDTIASPTSTSNKRISSIPPIPGSASGISSGQHTRAPPPPPPSAAPPSRRSTGDYKPLASSKYSVQDESEEEVTEYEGDYDTDMASSTHHKDALKSHAREASLDGSTTTEEQSTRPRGAAPPIPQSSAPRAVPPPPPSGHAPKPSRQSSDIPRGNPPPPPQRGLSQSGDDDDYDPFKYTAPSLPPLAASTSRSTSYTYLKDKDEDDLYDASPQEPRQPSLPPAAPPRSSQDQAAPPSSRAPQIAPSQTGSKTSRAPPRQSLDAPLNLANSRRSTDQGRASMDHGSIAADIDLGSSSLWWVTPPFLPPALQNRRDLVFEAEEASSTQRGGKTTVSKDVYVLFQDYSQTIINVRFDPQAPSDASLTQRHEPPPARLRQDQLEAANEKFGTALSTAVTSKQNTVVGDGQPFSLTTELFKSLPGALPPVGTRAFGALVYANIANGSVTQTDEIRAGDVLTLRNAKFVGHRGPMRQKYNVEVGKPDHVGVVVDWDGTKKKVRAWEQGRESKKVKVESYKVDDLRSGEVKVWRIVGREFVGWDGGN